ncbi:hypothetical protein FQN57_004982 [Myotisia sp. PD_48]|nr:hypothetical protein FQN57_004982 [Myotisia sp. PD_48]
MRCQWPEEFTEGSDLMSAHRLHKLDVDDKRLDGSKVLVAIQPAIVALGTNDGEMYDKPRTWLKAIVIVDEKQDLE